MRSTSILVVVLAILVLAGLAQADTVTVGPGEGYDHATIQAGINAALPGDTVIGAPWTYYENINFGGKNITVTSTTPDDWACVEATIIDGGYNNSVVTFSGSESSACQLRGFTIRNGNADWDIMCGGGIIGNETLGID